MKKLFTVLFVAGAMSIVACGPSAEEKAKMEADAQKLADSLLNAASQSITEAIDSAATTVVDSAATAAPATEEAHHQSSFCNR